MDDVNVILNKWRNLMVLFNVLYVQELESPYSPPPLKGNQLEKIENSVPKYATDKITH